MSTLPERLRDMVNGNHNDWERAEDLELAAKAVERLQVLRPGWPETDCGDAHASDGEGKV